MPTRLTLYFAGITPEANRVAAAVRAWCEQELGGEYLLEVLDLGDRPSGKDDIPIMAMPALVLPALSRVVVGDLTDVPAVMAALGLARKPT